MIAAEINDWIDKGRPYKEGLGICHKHLGENRNLIQLLELGESPFTRKKMSNSLHDLLAVQPPLEAQETAKSEPYRKQIVWNELPESLRAYREEFKTNRAKANYLRRELFSSKSGNVRQRNAKEIRRAHKRELEILNEINVFYSTGYFKKPIDQEDLAVKGAYYLKALKNNPSYISKNRKNPKNQEEVNRRQKELVLINQFIENGRIA